MSPDGSTTSPGSPYNVPADTPPPAYHANENDRGNENMDTNSTIHGNHNGIGMCGNCILMSFVFISIRLISDITIFT